MIWEAQRQHAQDLAAMWGPTTPKSPQLTALRTTYLEAYRDLALSLQSRTQPSEDSACG